MPMEMALQQIARGGKDPHVYSVEDLMQSSDFEVIWILAKSRYVTKKG
jgi:hypothetical protein